MPSNIQSIRGMRDIFTGESEYWLALEQTMIQLANSYGYNYLKMPLVEKTELFKRSIGDATDIVEKEMYTFLDRNDDSLSLRPEGTASCVRAGIQHGLLYNQRQKFWYMGPMFRHERPQKGRYRQFEQFGLEIFGIASVDVEIELILFCRELFSKLNILSELTLNINTIGNITERNIYKEHLLQYLKKHASLLDEQAKTRMLTNPLRILDSKNPEIQELIANAPKIFDFLSKDSQDNFLQLQTMLELLNIDFVVKPTLVRGLDYYNDVVFEWSTKLLGAQSEVCAGGRYDNLVEHLGGKPSPGVGLAIGLDRIVEMMKLVGFKLNTEVDVFIISEPMSEIRTTAFKIANSIRQFDADQKVLVYTGDANIKKQFKDLAKHNPKIIVVMQSNEFEKRAVTVKFISDDVEQKMYNIDNLLENIAELFAR